MGFVLFNLKGCFWEIEIWGWFNWDSKQNRMQGFHCGYDFTKVISSILLQLHGLMYSPVINFSYIPL